MGWDIKGWLFGRDNSSDDYKKEAKQLRRDLQEQSKVFNKQYLQSVADAKRRQKAYERRTNALNEQLGQLRIDSQAQAAAYEAQLGATQESNAAQVQGLQDLIIQNKQAYDTQAATLAGQVSDAQAAAEKQAKISQNLGRAYVPAPQLGALTPTLSQGAVESGVRKKKDNELSALSIVPSPSNNAIAQQLAGLQIA